MKKPSLLLALALMVPGLAFAKNTFPMGGCGLWYMVFGHESNSKGTQLGSVVLNDWVFPGGLVTSSMTSGTSGCNESGELRWARSAELFAEANFDTLKKEMAAGQGEYVATFSSLLGVPQEKTGDFARTMKENYSSLVPSESATSKDLMRNVSSLLASYQVG